MTSMFSYIESRGGVYDKTVFFGLQYYLQEYLSVPITMEMVEEAKEFYSAHGVPFNYDGWKYIAEYLDGKLPVRIRAVKEGSVVPNHNALITIESTNPMCKWLVTWIETSLLRVWCPINVATISYHCKQIINDALQETSDDPASELPFKLHDFGSRGSHSQESAAIGGAAHLVNFMGSDTVVGVLLANKHYYTKMSAFSIPASEHSTITSWGRENETQAYANMIKQFAKPGAIVACVLDSYDVYNSLENIIGGTLRQQIIDSGAVFVCRPDSGDPVTVVSKAIQILDEKFGSKVNSKGYKVLNNVRIIQGDGVNPTSIGEILASIKKLGFSATNIAFGMGGALLARHDRDSQKMAQKCSSVDIESVELGVQRRAVFKDPVTDPGKRSKSGRLDTIFENCEYKTVVLDDDVIAHPNTVMHTTFEDGELYNLTTLDEVRKEQYNVR